MNLYDLLIKGKEKAVVGFVVVAVLGALSSIGVNGDMTVKEAVNVIVTAVVTYVTVYLKRNNK